MQEDETLHNLVQSTVQAFAEQSSSDEMVERSRTISMRRWESVETQMTVLWEYILPTKQSKGPQVAVLQLILVAQQTVSCPQKTVGANHTTGHWAQQHLTGQCPGDVTCTPPIMQLHVLP